MNSPCRVVIINCFDTYEHRVELLRAFFQNRNCDVHVLTSDWRHFHKSVRTQCPEGYEMIHTLPYTKNLSAERLLSHHRFAAHAFARVEELKPDILWVLVPPNSLVKQAEAYKKRNPGTKLVLDIIDMWPETMPISRFKNLPPFTAWRNLRDKHLNSADAVVTECALYQTVLHNVCDPAKMHTLYLARDLQLFASNPNPPEDRISLCYLGSINNIIDIPCIGRIIRAIDGPVDLHIVGDGENRQALIDSAGEAGANVIFHGKVYDPVRKQQIMDKCHAGLNIMKESVFVGLTMKSMDYFEAGLPIINNIKGDTWQLVTDEQIGVNYSMGEKMDADVIASLQKHRGNVRCVFERYFTKESFSKNVDSILGNL